jgi:hypothetical protein
MFYRFAFQKNSSPNDRVANPATTDLTGGNTDDNKLYSFVANHSWTLSSTKLNQFSFHFQDFSNAILGVTTNPQLIFPGGITIGANTNVPQATTERKVSVSKRFLVAGAKPRNQVWRELHSHRTRRLLLLRSKGYTISCLIRRRRSPTTPTENIRRDLPHQAPFRTSIFRTVKERTIKRSTSWPSTSRTITRSREISR